MIIKKCVSGEYDYIVVTISNKDDSKIIESIKERASKDEANVNKKGPDGRERPKELIKYNNLGGVLAEEVFKFCLEKAIKDNKLSAKILPSVFTGHLEHRDIKIEINGKIKTIEIRSSFQYKQPDINKVLSHSFSLIGPYTTSYKGKEPKKDFYVTVIHRYENPEIMSRIDKDVEVFVVGGASEEVFNKIGNADWLKQENAEYLTIKPINETKGVDALINEILEIKKEIILSKQNRLF